MPDSNSTVTPIFPLKVVVMPTRAPVGDNTELYNAAYETWQKCWKAAFLELEGSDELLCDHFTRQEYMVALFDGKKCAALIFFRRIDTRLEAHRNDSYFEPWPKDFLREVSLPHETHMICSWITSLPEYRRTINGSGLADYQISLRLPEMMNFFMQDAGIDLTFGTVRINRSADKMCSYSGSKTIMKDMKHHGVAVDLITWEPKDLPQASAQFPKLAHDMWKNRVVYEDSVMSLSGLDRKAVRKTA